MISLEEYQQTLYRFAAQPAVEQHLRYTVLEPLGLLPSTSTPSSARSVRPADVDPVPALALFATPPCTTCVRLTGAGLIAHAETPQEEEEENAAVEDPTKGDVARCFPLTTRSPTPVFIPPMDTPFQPLSTLEDIGLPYCWAVQPCWENSQPQDGRPSSVVSAWAHNYPDWKDWKALSSPQDGEEKRPHAMGDAHQHWRKTVGGKGVKPVVVVVVNVGCAEAVLRGSDVYAPGILTMSMPFAEGEKVLLGVAITRSFEADDAHSKQREEGPPTTPSHSFSSPPPPHGGLSQWRTTLSRGQSIPSNLLQPPLKSCVVSSPELPSEDVSAASLSRLVVLGGGVAVMDSKVMMRDAKTKGVAIRVTWNVWGQPSRAQLDALFRTSAVMSHVDPRRKDPAAEANADADAAGKSFFLQNYSSMLPVSLLVRHLPSSCWSRRYPCVLDACAAPGGKSSLLLSLLAARAEEEAARLPCYAEDPTPSIFPPPWSQFRLVCCERSKTRHAQLVRLLEEHFVDRPSAPHPGHHRTTEEAREWLETVCCCLCKDMNQLVKEQQQELGGSAAPPHPNTERKEMRREKEFSAKKGVPSASSLACGADFCHFTRQVPSAPSGGVLDAVLLDPPCTGLGLRPKLLPHSHTLLDIDRAADYQRKLFDSAVQLLSYTPFSSCPSLPIKEGTTGGHEKKIIVYSTCTITLEENEGNVLHFLKTYPSLRLARAEGDKETALCTRLQSTQFSTAPAWTPSEEAASGVEKKTPRFLLEEEILALQRAKETEGLDPQTLQESHQKESGAVLVIRLMPKSWQHNGKSKEPAPTQKKPNVQFIPPSREDGVGFFVAVFELLLPSSQE